MTFAGVPHTAAEHFKLRCYQAVVHLRALVPGAEEELPFLLGYFTELDETGLDAAGWEQSILAWEAESPVRLPLVALRAAAGLEHGAFVLLFIVGLLEEDPRFGELFEALNGAVGRQRPTAALLHGWLGSPSRPGEARRSLRRLVELGLLESDDPDAPPGERSLRVSSVLWNAIRGDAPEHLAPWARYRPATTAVPADDLILPDAIRDAVARVPEALAAAGARVVVVRGPGRSGRRTLLGSVARSAGLGTLELAGLAESNWQVVGPLATVLGAMPVIELDVAPGETAELPQLDGYDGAFGVALGRQGGLTGAGVENALVLELDLPGVDDRELHWRAALGDHPAAPELAIRRRMTGGNIRRAATLAHSQAALAGRQSVAPDDVRAALRVLHGRLLDTLAARVPDDADWSFLAASDETLRELELLESRCRHRERLSESVGPALASQLTAGVRALFTGPSGTGKTLAARVLASGLGLDLYRIDLSRVVNKYLGETEKNLSTIFARAEEADIALILDEGDSLLTQRTAVQNSNDRWANLETNYLLQRLESFEGILFVTTNADERIDAAFRRRMDVVIEFRAPDSSERWAIWQLHLPEDHTVGDALLNDVTVRCSLTGGQIRNAVLHASLLALDESRPLDDDHLHAAVAREYRKAGQVCPLPRELLGTRG